MCCEWPAVGYTHIDACQGAAASEKIVRICALDGRSPKANQWRFTVPVAAPYRIETLAVDDLEGMNQLLSVFSVAFDEPETYDAHRPSEPYLRDLLGRAYFTVVVARAGTEVVAGLAAYELVKFEQERSEFYIYDLAVAEAHRRQGLATALIESLKGVAARRGGSVIFVQADFGDDPAIALYASLGVREEVLHFDIPVRPSDSNQQ